MQNNPNYLLKKIYLIVTVQFVYSLLNIALSNNKNEDIQLLTYNYDVNITTLR